MSSLKQINPEIARDLSLAIYQMSRETMSDMSIDALKQRFSELPGIDNLTMRQEGGRQIFSLGGPFVEIALDATEAEIETALMSIAPGILVGTRFATPLPVVSMNGAATSPLPSPTGFVPGSISSIFKSLRARREAMVAGIQADGAELAALIDAGEQMGTALKAEKEAIKAEFHGLTNFPTS